jgi:hypothetical protein
MSDKRRSQRHRDDVIDVVVLVAMWGLAVARDFDAFVIFIASLWSLRIGLFERRGYRLLTRGNAWWPSKNPDDYR